MHGFLVLFSLGLQHSCNLPLLQGFTRNVEELLGEAHTTVNYSGLRAGGLVHVIHTHLDAAASASTKAKLEVEPVNSLDSFPFYKYSPF